MLAERLGLKLHREERKMGAVELIVDEGGPKFQVSGPDPGYNVTVSRGRGRLSAQNLSMRQFVEILGYLVDVPLVDKTGITGAFEAKLEWAPEPASADAQPAPEVSDRADLRTALREQLGLRLVSVKLPVEVLVVDSVEKPSEN